MFCSDDKSSLHDVSQDEDPRLSPSSTSSENYLSCSENSYTEDWSEGDVGCLGSNLENNVELGSAEHSETTDKNQSSDIIQVEDRSLSQSTTSVDDFLTCPQNSCKVDWSEGDVGCLGKNLENNVELGMAENSETADKFQSSDITIVINEPMKDLNVEETVMEYTDIQPCEHVLEVDPTSMNPNENEISTCKGAECIIPKTIPMLELLVLNTRQCHLKNIKEKLAPIWKIIADHRYAGPFRNPLKEWEAPGYKEIVKRPMDLATVKKGLSKGTIRTSAQFQRDILLMLQNAVMYNSVYHTVHQKALEIQRDVEELLQVFNEQVKESEME